MLPDVRTSAGLLLGFALVPLTGSLRLDFVLARLVALNILPVGFELVRHSIGGPIDEGTDRAQSRKSGG